MADKTLTCKECNTQFVFSESEQDFYREKGFQNEPQRCSTCREARKQQKRSSSNFGGGSRFGNRMGGQSTSSRW